MRETTILLLLGLTASAAQADLTLGWSLPRGAVSPKVPGTLAT
jgi:hypothetical protein